MSVDSADAIVLLNPLASLTLKDSGDIVSVAATGVPYDEVVGFGALKEIMFELVVTAVSLTGGSGPPNAQLTVWVQRKTPSGQWDDLLALKTATMLSGALPIYHVAEYPGPVIAAPTPALIQDGGGSPAFAPRGAWLSDALRAKALLVVTGSPTAQAVTWALYARGRP